MEAGLALLEAGGDVADGVIALEGQWPGGPVFLSFNRQAVALLQTQGIAAQLLAGCRAGRRRKIPIGAVTSPR
jgi:hypothetical protein